MPRRVPQANFGFVRPQSRGPGWWMPNTLLGHSTTHGLGYRQDYIRAYLWFSLAVAH